MLHSLPFLRLHHEDEEAGATPYCEERFLATLKLFFLNQALALILSLLDNTQKMGFSVRIGDCFQLIRRLLSSSFLECADPVDDLLQASRVVRLGVHVPSDEIGFAALMEKVHISQHNSRAQHQLSSLAKPPIVLSREIQIFSLMLVIITQFGRGGKRQRTGNRTAQIPTRN
jgi:hypothetical protein